ncbi:MAG TPA: hypothetical protein DE060_16480 [Lentisphaeria bacterium]|nr:hypothetical protein [Lentisphaeria bacterium]HCG50787.1 hypothetical protein [Lentisphaeria bacterium]
MPRRGPAPGSSSKQGPEGLSSGFCLSGLSSVLQFLAQESGRFRRNTVRTFFPFFSKRGVDRTGFLFIIYYMKHYR